MVKLCTFASEYNIIGVVCKLHYFFDIHAIWKIIHLQMTYCCQCFSNYLGVFVVFISMFMLMPLLSVEVLCFTCLYNDNHLLGDCAQ